MMNKWLQILTSKVTAVVAACVMMLSAATTGIMMVFHEASADSPSAPVPHTARYKVISVGDTHTLGIRFDGSLWAWGDNWSGGLGIGDVGEYDFWGQWKRHNQLNPVQVGEYTDWTHVAAGGGHSLGIRADGSLWAWGWNSDGALGVGDNIIRTVPTQVGTDTDWKHISAGWTYTLGIRTDGSLWAWGGNDNGYLGIGDVGEYDYWGQWRRHNQPNPVQVGTDTDWAHVSAGNGHSLGIRENGTLWSWGLNWGGQLGLGDTELRLVPTQVGEDTDWTHAESGRGHSIGIRDGTIFTWGDNDLGQLGLGDSGLTANRTVPMQVGVNTDWLQVGLGNFHNFGIRADGTLWAWGANWDGQLGIGDVGEYDFLGDWILLDQTSPVQVGTDTDWVHADGGWEHSVGLRSSGSLWVFGSNSYGALGIGDYGRYVDYGLMTRWERYSLLTPFGPTPDQLDPLPFNPQLDLSDVEMIVVDDRVVLSNLDEERIEKEKLSFRWYRKVGDDSEILIEESTKPWVTLELHPDDDVTYRVEILIDDDDTQHRERTFNPPDPTPNPNPDLDLSIPIIIAGLVALLAFVILILILVARRRYEQKQKKA